MKKTLTYLITIAALMLISAGAMAQGGANPFVGSTHGYKIIPGNSGNTFQWTVAGSAVYTVNSVSATTDSINITWDAAGIDTLVFTEIDAVTGCQTVKELEIIIQPNTFDVTISDSTIACNSADGAINFTGSDTTTLVSFTVDTIGVDWDHDWEIEFTLISAATLENITFTDGTLSGSGTVGDPYVLTDISGSSPNVVISMDVKGNAFVQQTVVMDLIAATELKYNTPALLNENSQSISYVNAIPDTSGITTD